MSNKVKRVVQYSTFYFPSKICLLIASSHSVLKKRPCSINSYFGTIMQLIEFSVYKNIGLVI